MNESECIECVQLCDHISTLCAIHCIWMEYGVVTVQLFKYLPYFIGHSSHCHVPRWIPSNFVFEDIQPAHRIASHHIASAACQSYRWCFFKDWLNRKRKEPDTNWNILTDSCASHPIGVSEWEDRRRVLKTIPFPPHPFHLHPLHDVQFFFFFSRHIGWYKLRTPYSISQCVGERAFCAPSHPIKSNEWKSNTQCLTHCVLSLCVCECVCCSFFLPVSGFWFLYLFRKMHTMYTIQW